MSNTDFKTDTSNQNGSWSHKIAFALRRSGEYALRDVLRFGSLTLVLFGAVLLVTGVLCRHASSMPEWTGIVPVTGGLVILIFLTGRHS